MANVNFLAENHEESNGTAVVAVNLEFVAAERPSIGDCIKHLKESGLRITRSLGSTSKAEIRALDRYKSYHIGGEVVISAVSGYKIRDLKKSQFRVNNLTLFGKMKKERRDIVLKVIFILRDPEEGYLVTFDVVG